MFYCIEDVDSQDREDLMSRVICFSWDSERIRFAYRDTVLFVDFDFGDDLGPAQDRLAIALERGVASVDTGGNNLNWREIHRNTSESDCCLVPFNFGRSRNAIHNRRH